MIRFQCPQCGSKLTVKDTKAGALGMCPGCGTKLRIPPAPVTEPAPSPTPARQGPPIPTLPKSEEKPSAYAFEAPPSPPPVSKNPQTPRRQPVRDEWAERDDDDDNEPETEARAARPRSPRKKRRARKDRDWEASDFRPFLGIGVAVGVLLIVAALSFLVPGLGYITVCLGYLVGFVGSIWLLVTAFQESIGWGLACLLIPCIGLVFVATHLDRALKPFLVNVGGSILVVIGMVALAAQH